MTPLKAKISFGPVPQDGRKSARKRLRLGIAIASSDSWSDATVHDLSESGLMFEVAAPLEIGEAISIEMPGGELADARIVWKAGTQYGCEFLNPISATAVSAALLLTDPKSLNPLPAEGIGELPVGIGPSVDDLSAWKSEFDRSIKPSGYRLIGFRQKPGGLLVAIVSKWD